MSEVFFYHLTETPLEAALPTLLEKSLERGWRVAVQGPHADRLAFLDRHLWSYGEQSFLPHGQAGGDYDARQPVLLTQSAEFPNEPQILMLIDGATAPSEQLDRFDRVCVLFDGNDEVATSEARSYWTQLKDAGADRKYWFQQGGRWTQKNA